MRRAAIWLKALFLSGYCAGWAQAQSLPPPYVDRVMEGIAPQDPELTDENRDYNTDGWTRYLKFETRLGSNPFSAQRGLSSGYSLYALIETPHYGVLTVDASLAPGLGHAMTLRQRDMPLSGGWRVNNELGIVSPVVPPIARVPSRVSIPATLVEGLSTEWRNASLGLQFQASSGRPGRLEGAPSSGFKVQPGQLTQIGGEAPAGEWSIAGRLAQAAGVSLADSTTGAMNVGSADSLFLTARRLNSSGSLQINSISTRSDQSASTRNGLWLDAASADGAQRSSWGAFWLDPGLTWAGLPMASNARGGYFRTGWKTRRWGVDASVDVLRGVSPPSSTGIFSTASAFWRYSRTVFFTSGVSVRRFNGDAVNTFGDVRWENDWGFSGVRLSVASSVASSVDNSRLRSISLDHDWRVPTNWSLATSASYGRETTLVAAHSVWSASLAVNAPVTDSTSLRANLSTEQSSVGDARSNANMGLSWRLASHWQLEGTYNLSLGKTTPRPLLDPLALPAPTPPVVSAYRMVFLALRFQAEAGTRMAPLGGRPLDGGGSIQGRVFLDGNRNGTQEASETGAPAATVLMDGRYAVRTDDMGRFEFPFVAAGTHTLTVLNETLPLPWLVPQEGRVSVEVVVRETTQLDIPAQRPNGE